MKRIAIIDTDNESVQGVRSCIERLNQFSIFGSYTSYSQAVRKFKKCIPDIVLVDINIQDEIAGLLFLRYVCSRYPPIKVIVLSTRTDQKSIFKAFKIGVSGYLLKPSNHNELEKALSQLDEGGAPLSPGVSRIIVDSFHINAESILTRRESEVLNLLALGKTYIEIANDSGMSPLTSRVHIRNIYKKLNANSKAEAILAACKRKYILPLNMINLTLD